METFLNILNLVLGVVMGFASGYYFERRSAIQSRKNHEDLLQSNEQLRSYINELETQLSNQQQDLRSSVKDLKSSVFTAAIPTSHLLHQSSATITGEILLDFIKERFDEHGRSSLPQVRSALLNNGFKATDIDNLIQTMNREGIISITGKQVEIS